MLSKYTIPGGSLLIVSLAFLIVQSCAIVGLADDDSNDVVVCPKSAWDRMLGRRRDTSQMIVNEEDDDDDDDNDGDSTFRQYYQRPSDIYDDDSSYRQYDQKPSINYDDDFMLATESSSIEDHRHLYREHDVIDTADSTKPMNHLETTRLYEDSRKEPDEIPDLLSRNVRDLGSCDSTCTICDSSNRCIDRSIDESVHTRQVYVNMPKPKSIKARDKNNVLTSRKPASKISKKNNEVGGDKMKSKKNRDQDKIEGDRGRHILPNGTVVEGGDEAPDEDPVNDNDPQAPIAPEAGDEKNVTSNFLTVPKHPKSLEIPSSGERSDSEELREDNFDQRKSDDAELESESESGGERSDDLVAKDIGSLSNDEGGSRSEESALTEPESDTGTQAPTTESESESRTESEFESRSDLNATIDQKENPDTSLPDLHETESRDS